MRSAVIALIIGCTPGTGAVEQEVGGTYTVLRNLSETDGKSVRGHLTESGGRLYGLAGENGPNAAPDCSSAANWNLPAHTQQCPGTLFSLALDGSDFRVEHAFSQLNAAYRNDDGYHPYGSLAVDDNGVLYGVTSQGGQPAASPTARGAGVLFAYDPAASSFVVLHHFLSAPQSADGLNPHGTPAVIGGAVYGTTKAGGSGRGVVFRYESGAFSYSALPLEAGSAPYGGLAVGHDGVLHGMTHYGAANGRGAYFVVDPATLTIAVVGPFPGYTDPANGTDNTPIQAPVVLSNGDVVALREFGGAAGTGLLAHLSPTGVEVLREFDGVSISSTPRFSNATAAMTNGQPAEGRDGLLYGTGMYGGDAGTGGIYRVSRDGSLFQLLLSFPASPSRAYGGLTAGSDGALYGVTWNGSSVFRYQPPTGMVCQ